MSVKLPLSLSALCASAFLAAHTSRDLSVATPASGDSVGINRVAAAAPHVGPREYLLTNVEWHLTLHPETASIEGDVINSLRLLKAQPSVKFDCGPLNISSVKANGVPATCELKGEVLTVNLPDQGRSMDYKIEIRYSGAPTGGVYFVSGATAYPAHTPVVYSQGAAEDNRYWLPTYDFPDNKATSEGYITVPKGWKALSNGRLIGEKTTGAQTTVHWKMAQPHSTYLISFVAGPYDVGHESWGTMPVEYWTPAGLADWGKATFGGTNKIIDFYSKQLGTPYPYDKFAQSAVPEFMFGGMENITCVTQSINALYPPSEAPVRDSTNLIAHELAHQWFGDLVTCADWEHTWINEGFATFMPPFYARASKGEDAFQAEREGIFREEESNRDPHPVAWKDFAYPSEIYRGEIYSGGAARMYMLMYKLGEARFWAGVHDFLKRFEYRPVTTQEFFASMSKSCGEDLTPFMNQWMFTSGVPHIAVKADGDDLVLTATGGSFDIDPDVWIWNDGAWVKATAHFSSNSHVYHLRVGASVARQPVFVDPEGHYLLVQNPAPNLENVPIVPLFDKLPAFSKSRLIRTLSDQAAIRELFTASRNFFYREALIGRMDRSNFEVLRGATGSIEPRVRLAAVNRLRALKGPESGSTGRLNLTALQADPVPSIRVAAFMIALDNSSDGKLAMAAWSKEDEDGDRYRTAALSWWESHDKNAARDHALEALDRSYSEPVQLEAIRILGYVRDAPGERRVFEHLIKVLGGGAYRQKTGAMNALVSYGDKAALPAIEPLTHVSLFFTREAAERAYADLKDR